MNNKEFLNWIYERLRYHHQENPNQGFMIRLRDLRDNINITKNELDNDIDLTGQINNMIKEKIDRIFSTKFDEINDDIFNKIDEEIDHIIQMKKREIEDSIDETIEKKVSELINNQNYDNTINKAISELIDNQNYDDTINKVIEGLAITTYNIENKIDVGIDYEIEKILEDMDIEEKVDKVVESEVQDAFQKIDIEDKVDDILNPLKGKIRNIFDL